MVAKNAAIIMSPTATTMQQFVGSQSSGKDTV